MKWIFWLAMVFIIYTYIGYPLLIWLLAQLRPSMRSSSPLFASEGELPAVSIIIAAYNEVGRVREKLKNLAELAYPLDKLDIVVVSDGSSDGTEDAVRDAGGVRLIAYPVRRGKPYALAQGVAAARADIIVFMDVRQRLLPMAVRYLIETLQCPGIGLVSGELVHQHAGSQQAARIGLYWRYEKSMRKAESRWWSTIGTTGALYAIRRADFHPLPEDTILDDFELPMAIVRRGARAVLDGRALMYDELQVETAGEQRRKVRTLTGNFQSFARNLWLFSPFANPVWFQFVSHKVFRLLVPYALVALLLSGWMLDGIAYRLFSWAQVIAYALALLARCFRTVREHRLISVISVFVELNVAAVLALIQFVAGRASARWEKT